MDIFLEERIFEIQPAKWWSWIREMFTRVQLRIRSGHTGKDTESSNTGVFTTPPSTHQTVQKPSLSFCIRGSNLDTSNIREGSSQHLLKCFIVCQPLYQSGAGGLANLATAYRGMNLGSGRKLRGLLDTHSHMLGLWNDLKFNVWRCLV